MDDNNILYVNKGNRRTIMLLKLRQKAQLYGSMWGKIYNIFSRYLCTCDIPYNIKIGNGLRMPHAHGIVISSYSEIGENCTIYHNVTIGANEHKLNYKNGPKIGNGVYISANSVLIGDIIVGDNCIIGANATVTKDIPPNSMVVGNNKIIPNNIERNPHPLA